MCGEEGHSGRDLPQRGLHPFKGVHCRGGLVVCAGVCVGGGGGGGGGGGHIGSTDFYLCWSPDV